MDEKFFDAIIVGAGAAGLMAARELVLTGKKVAVIEARERPGGRMHTIHDPAFEMPVELGAEFVHGNLQPSLSLLDKAGIKYYEVGGEMWQNKEGKLQEQDNQVEQYGALKKKFKELKEDLSVNDFIENYLQEPELEELRLSLRNYVEGYYAANAGRASTFALRDELFSHDEEQYRIEGGYIGLFEWLMEEAKKRGAGFYFSQPVQSISWKEDEVEVQTEQQTFRSQKILVTVPMGVLKAGTIRFSPALPDQMKAAQHLGFGPVIKIILQFSEPFWKDQSFTQQQDMREMGFVFSQELVPTWWTYLPKEVAMLTGWSAGPHARELAGRSNVEILDSALDSLSRIFTMDNAELRHFLKGWHVANWMDDPYSCGAYSFEVVGGEAAKKVLLQPVAQTVFFAGEGLYSGPEIGTVNAALVIGRDMAHQVVASFKKQNGKTQTGQNAGY